MRYGLGQTCGAGFQWAPMPTFGNPLAGQCLPLSAFTPNPAPAYVPTTAVLTNVSRPGQSFQVGDSWSLTIAGNAGVAVTGSASQNGASASTTPFGSTDETGKLVLSGTFGAGDVGTWVEQWLVGSGSPATVSFTVSNPIVATPPGLNPVGTPAPSNYQPPATGSGSPVAPLSASFLTNEVSIFGMQVPVWALIGGGVGLLFMSRKL